MEYKEYLMEDALEAIIDYRGKTPKKSDTGIPTLSAKSVKNNYINYSECYYISPAEYERFMVRGFPRKGDILLTTEAPMGMVAKLDRDDVAIAQRLLTLRGKSEVLDNDYLLYLLQSPYGQGLLKAKETGTTVTGIKQAAFRKINIRLPDIKTQMGISSILNSLNQKIECNIKINDNLQRQSFAVFDRLLSKNHSSECCLSQIAVINPKRTLKKNETARCIDMAQLSTSGSFPNGWEIKPYNGGMRFSNGDTLLARITPCLENGKTAYIDFLNENEVAFGSTEYVVIASQGEYPPEFFYCLARYPAFVDYAVKNMNGSSGRQRVSAETIENYVLPVLTDDELSEFRSTVPSLFKAMKNNSIENMSLAQLRDALLPKLMSGEIDVSNIQ